MQFKMIEAGLYRAENGYMIKANRGENMFTKRMMATEGWYTYNEKGERINYSFTLREAKAEAEEIVAGLKRRAQA